MIVRLTEELEKEGTELTPADFLRRVSYDNPELTGNFIKFNDKAAEYHMDSDSSDDECESQASTQCSQPTTTFSSLSHTSHTHTSTNENSFDAHSVQSSFEPANDDDMGDGARSLSAQLLFEQTNNNDAAHMDTSYEDMGDGARSLSAQLSFQRTHNKDYAYVNPNYLEWLAEIAATVNEKDEEKKRKEGENRNSEENKRMEEEKRKEEEKKRIEEEEKKKEEKKVNDRGKCEICEERIVDLAAAPCGHMFCRICWDANLASIRTKYKSARTIARKLKEPDCMMCRTRVTSVIKVFFRK